MAIVQTYLNSRNGNVERYIGGPPKNCLNVDQINKSIKIISQLMEKDHKELSLYISFGFQNEEYYSYRDGSLNSLIIASGAIPANLEEKLNEFCGEASRYNAAFKIPGWISYNAYKLTYKNILQVYISIEYLEGILEPVEGEEESTFISDDNPFSYLITEAYVGKEAVQPILDQLKIIRNMVKNKPYDTHINTSKEVLKINRIIEKIFGYETFSFTISPDNDINAYAINTAIYQTEEEKQRMINALRISNSTGFRYDKMGRVSAMISINMGTMNHDDISDEEIMGTMLHEIGHTFFMAIVGTDIAATRINITRALNQLNKMIINRISSGRNTDMNEIVNDVKSIPIKVSKRLSTSLGSIAKRARKQISKIKNIKLFSSNEAMIDDMTDSEYEYTNEKFADTFAAIYGYGAEVHSFLLKIYNIYKKDYPESKNPVVVVSSIIKRNFKDMLLLMLKAQDEHPYELARLKTSIEYTKRELAKQNIDPKMKMELSRQLEDLNKLLDDYINFPKDEDSMYITRQYYIQLYKKFGGDRREKKSNNNQLFDQIDKRFGD